MGAATKPNEAPSKDVATRTCASVPAEEDVKEETEALRENYVYVACDSSLYLNETVKLEIPDAEEIDGEREFKIEITDDFIDGYDDGSCKEASLGLYDGRADGCFTENVFFRLVYNREFYRFVFT